MSSKTNSRFLTSCAISGSRLAKPSRMFFSVSRSTKFMTLRERLDAAGLGEVGAADQQAAAEQFVELLQHFRCGLLENRDAHRDFGLQFGRRAARARRRLVPAAM